MHIYKSQQIGCFHRTFGVYKKKFLSVTSIIPFNLLDQSVAKEQDFWAAISKSLDEGVMFDSGIAKDRHEFIINSSAFAPNDELTQELLVEAKIGSIQKVISVTGERKRIGNEVSEARPFNSMPIKYSYAFGGTSSETNPLGLGLDEIEGETNLPTCEYPNQKIKSKNDRPHPASFSQLAPNWQPRYSKIGSYEDPIDDDFGFSDDIDWLFFNDTAEDQWFKEPLNGDEHYQFTNMHPEHSDIKGSLPSFIPRTFINIKDTEEEKEDKFMEVGLTLDTLWFSPENLMGALVFHGAVEVKDRYANEVSHLLMAFEHKEEKPRSKEHYHFAILDRMKPEMALKYSVFSKDIIPERCECLLDVGLQPDEDALQMFTLENQMSLARNLIEKEGLAIREKIDAAISLVKESLNSASESLRQQISAKNFEKIEALEHQIKGFEKQLFDLENEKLEAEQSIKQGITNLSSQSGSYINQIDDPDLKELFAFIDECFPKSKNNPNQIDLARVDFKKFEQFQEKAEAMAAKKIEIEKNNVIAVFDEQKSNLQVEIDESKEKKLEIERYLKYFEEEVLPHKQQFIVKGLWDKLSKQHEQMRNALDKINRLPLLMSELNNKLEDIVSVIEKRKLLPFPRPKPLELLLNEQGIEEQLKQEKLQCNELITGLNEESEKFNSIKETELVIDESLLQLKQAIEKNIKNKGDENGREAYRMGAHLFEQGSIIEGHNIEISLDKLIKGETLNENDFSCIQLNNHTIKKLDLSYKYCEQLSFVDSKFEDINFSYSIFARSNFVNCEFKNCDFSHSNLGAMNIQKCVFEECKFDQTILSHSKVNSVMFDNCLLDSCQTLEMDLGIIKAKNSTILRLNFLNDHFIELNLEACKLEFCVFIEPICNKLGLVDSHLYRTTFIQLICETKANMKSMLLDNSSFIKETQLVGADFSGMQSINSSFYECQLNDTVWLNADVMKTYFGNSNFKNSDFNGANCSGSNFGRSDLSGAKLSNSNLMECDFSECRLVDARFDESNLFSANFLDAVMGNNSFKHSNLNRTIIKDWQP